MKAAAARMYCDISGASRACATILVAAALAAGVTNCAVFQSTAAEAAATKWLWRLKPPLPARRIHRSEGAVRTPRVVKPETPVFVTQVTCDRAPLFADPTNVILLREVLHHCKERHPFHMIAYIFLPDHMHLLIEPQDDATISIIMAAVKAEFSMRLRKARALSAPVMVWQKGFWDHIIRDQEDLQRHIDYIHGNPVRHGFVDKPEAWLDSSYSWWKRNGYYEDGWGWSNPEDRMSSTSWPEGME